MAFVLTIDFVGVCGYVPNKLSQDKTNCDSLYVLMVNALRPGRCRPKSNKTFEHFPHTAELAFSEKSIFKDVDKKFLAKHLSLSGFADIDEDGNVSNEHVNRKIFLRKGVLEIKLIDKYGKEIAEQISGPIKVERSFLNIPTTEQFLNNVNNINPEDRKGLFVKSKYLTDPPKGHLFSRIELKGGTIVGHNEVHNVKFPDDDPFTPNYVGRLKYTLLVNNPNAVGIKLVNTNENGVDNKFCVRLKYDQYNRLDLYIINEAGGPLETVEEDIDFELIYRLVAKKNIETIEGSQHRKLYFPKLDIFNNAVPECFVNTGSDGTVSGMIPRPILCFGVVFNDPSTKPQT